MAKFNKTGEPSDSILVVFTGSYLGDITLSGFQVTTQQEWDEHLTAVEKMFNEAGSEASFQTFFGSQESMGYDSFITYKRHFKVIPMTNSAKDFLVKNFKKGFGQFLTLDEIDIKVDEKEIKEIIAKKEPVITANFFNNLRMDKRW